MARFCTCLLAILLFVSCSSEEAADYTEVTESEFLAACTDPLSDDRLIADLCECVFDETQQNLKFDEYVAIDKKLAASETPTLPNEIAELVADCVISESNL